MNTSRSIQALVGFLMLATLGCATVCGCVKEKLPEGTGGDGAAANSPQDAASTTATPDSAASRPPKNCLELRGCVFRCKTDAACASQCYAQAPAAAQTKFKAVEACSRKQCPNQDIGCRCTSECFFPSECAEVLDQCTEAQEDPFCAMHCL